jgi:membrane associated rhomboid family serine protease
MKATAGGQGFMRGSAQPGTVGLIATLLGTFVISWVMRGALVEPLQFWTDWSHPWGLVTYAWASTGDGQGLFWFLIELYWLWWVGTSAERELGTAKYLAFFFAATVAAALFLWAGLAVVHGGVRLPILGGPGLAISALTVAWGFRNPRGTILLFAIIPISGLILAWLTIALTLFGYGSMYQAPLIGLFAILHLGLAYLFATNRFPGVAYARTVAVKGPVKATEARDKGYYDDVRKREKEREERERLRKLFESSMKDDPDR